ncbi:hypothetical protein [Fibrella forsythiae]|uniref:Class I SAM-dependent methyltransferase n=1 Tax=Fibrella forsythiae TaxID=2817061 RepID=A0ABS3JQN5_9BACT|nr:hypothetical protein [Fibrella forsythiae]MBO0952316.1 hypothetical protein [Fibrella forsythiae]
MKALDKSGNALPWYTFPCIDILVRRDFRDKHILEFGGGQSSIWWGNHAADVVSFEGNKEWFDYIKKQMPANVELHYVHDQNAAICLKDVQSILVEKGRKTFDVIIIDGLWRYELIPLCVSLLSEDGVIICDNSEGYEFRQGFDTSGMQRVDYYGYASGAIMRTCTSLFFRTNTFVFDNKHRLITNGFN